MAAALLGTPVRIDGARTRATVKSQANKLITDRCFNNSVFRNSQLPNHGPFPTQLSENDGTALAIPAILCAQGAATSHQSQETKMEIKRVGSQPSVNGPADWFTGTVRIDPLFQANAPARTSGASVTFEPGARTAWHTHPLGQTLIVTAGCGWAQRDGGLSPA
jgi:hypothetical protein